MSPQFLRSTTLAKRAATSLSARADIRSYASLAQSKAKEQQDAGWLGTCTDGSETKSYVNGRWEKVGKNSLRWYEVKDPVRAVFLPDPMSGLRRSLSTFYSRLSKSSPKSRNLTTNSSRPPSTQPKRPSRLGARRACFIARPSF